MFSCVRSSGGEGRDAAVGAGTFMPVCCHWGNIHSALGHSGGSSESNQGSNKHACTKCSVKAPGAAITSASFDWLRPETPTEQVGGADELFTIAGRTEEVSAGGSDNMTGRLTATMGDRSKYC